MFQDCPELKFEIQGVLGKGSFSNVYKARNKLNNRIYALKKVLLSSLKKRDVDNSFNEI